MSKENETPIFSYTIGIPAALLEDKNLSNSQKILMINLIGLSHKEGYCWGTDKFLSEKLGCSVPTLQRDLVFLEKEEYIVRKTFLNGMKKVRHIYVTNAFSKKVYEYSSVSSPNTHQREVGIVTSEQSNNRNTNNRNMNKKISKEIQKMPAPSQKSVAVAPSPQKISFGEFQRVKLSQEDYDDLEKRLGKDRLTDLVNAVDAWLEENGKSKKNYKATILNWARREKNFNPTIAKEDVFKKHKEGAEKLRTILFSKSIPRTFRMDCCSKYVEIGHSDHPNKEVIKYEEKGFQSLLEHKLRKMNMFQYLT